MTAAQQPFPSWLDPMAATVTLTFTLPVAYTDGSPLDPASIVSRRVEWTGACPGFGYIAPQNSIVYPGNEPRIVVENVTPGNTRCFRVYVSAITPGCIVSAADPCLRESDASNVWTQAVVDPSTEPEPEPEPVPVSVPSKTPRAPILF